MRNQAVDSKIATAPAAPPLDTIIVSSVTAPANVIVDSVTASAPAPNTGTITTVAASATSVTILADNTARYGAVIHNDSVETLYLALTTAAASTTAFTVVLAGNENYELPVVKNGVYTGIIKGIWTVASGNARVTEFTV